MAVVAGCEISDSPTLDSAFSLDSSSTKLYEQLYLRKSSSDFLINSLKQRDEAISSRPIACHCALWPVKMKTSDTDEEDPVFRDAT